MKFLLDTHLLLWTAQNSPKLSAAAKKLINNSENDLFFSSASLWEIAIKSSSKRKNFTVNVSALWHCLVDNEYIELPIRSDHAVIVENLPLIHKDPFDRILLAQALVEGITLLTSDARLAEYSGPIQRV